VGYRVNTACQLERLGKALTWDGLPSSTSPGGPVFLNYPAGASSAPAPASTIVGNWAAVGTFGQPPQPPYTTGTDPDYQVLSDEVYRMDFSFLMSNGTFFAPAPITSGSTWRDTQGFKDVAAVVVTIAILDDHSRALLPSSQFNTIMQSAVNLLQPGSNASVALQWMSITNNGLGLGSGTPWESVASQIRVYQRYFYLNTD
jgi:hypothetical protein